MSSADAPVSGDDEGAPGVVLWVDAGRVKINGFLAEVGPFPPSEAYRLADQLVDAARAEEERLA